MRRREKFLLSSLLLAFGLLATQYIPLDFRWLGAIVLFIVAYIVSAWALLDDLSGVEWLMIPSFPALYAVSVSMFYYLLPENILSKIAVLVLFGVGMYALYLTCNIYSVAKARTIQLLRAAHAVGLFFALIITFFMANTIFSLRLPFWQNALSIALATTPLAIIALWSYELKRRLERLVLVQAGMIGFLAAGLAATISFFPASIWTNSLMMVGVVYVGLGMFSAKITGRLYQSTVYEYLAVAIVMATTFFLLLPWK